MTKKILQCVSLQLKLHIKYLYYPIIILLLALTATEFFPAFGWIFSHIKVYQWMLYGMAAYFIIRMIPFASRNELWLQTFSHELSHTVVSLMFFQKIHSFRADEDNGIMWHSGRRWGGIFISLAPYCLPIYTFAFLLLRIIGANKMLYIFDLLIGFTLAFHLVCFWKQARPYQIDIQRQGYVRAYLFIAVALLFNTTIILLSIRKGIVGAVCYLFPKYWNDIAGWWNMIF